MTTMCPTSAHGRSGGATNSDMTAIGGWGRRGVAAEGKLEKEKEIGKKRAVKRIEIFKF